MALVMQAANPLNTSTASTGITVSTTNLLQVQVALMLTYLHTMPFAIL
jgi:hypothetical protein